MERLLTMTVLHKFAAAVSLLADSGLDPLATASLTELRDAIVAKCSKVTIDTNPAELVVIVNLVEDLDTLLDRLSEQHRAINNAADGVAA
jgi:hypothetical protein